MGGPSTPIVSSALRRFWERKFLVWLEVLNVLDAVGALEVSANG